MIKAQKGSETEYRTIFSSGRWGNQKGCLEASQRIKWKLWTADEHDDRVYQTEYRTYQKIIEEGSKVNDVLLESVKRKRDLEDKNLTTSEARLNFHKERTSLE